MSVISAMAIFFIIWWLVLFTVLPIGIRSQVEDDDVTLGTEHGAPARPALVRKALLTTAIAIVIFGIFYVATVFGGFSFDDLPRIVPRFQ